MKRKSKAPDPVDPIFISYRQSDGTDITARLAWLLRAAGIPVWRDRDDLPPGDTEARLQQAISAGVSGGILVTTEDVANSRVVKMLEAPRLILLHELHEDFVLGIANAIKTESGGTSYSAPDRVLDLPTGTLSGVNQYPADHDGLLTLVRGLVWHRIASLRKRVKTRDGIFHLSVQTRNTPQVYDRTGADLDIRIRPSEHERLPSTYGLRDLIETIGFLPDAVTRSGATRIRIAGGAHLSVAFALGAAVPSTRIGHMEVMDQRLALWKSDGESCFTSQPQVQIADKGTNPLAIKSGRPKVGIYVDLLNPRSDSAFERFLEDKNAELTAWLHLTNVDKELLKPSQAGPIAADVAAHIRSLSLGHENAEVHILLRCPFPLAPLIARLTNTLRFVVYEWDDSEPHEDDDYRPRYVPALRVRASASTGTIESILL